MTDKKQMEEKQSKPVVKGNVYVPKQSKIQKLYSIFFSASPSDVIKSVVRYVLLPDAKYTMNNMWRKAGDMMAYGIDDNGRPRADVNRRTSIRNHDYTQHSRKGERRTVQNSASISSSRADDWKYIEFEYADDCDRIIVKLQEDIMDYEYTTVARIIEEVGTPDQIHFEWGWEDLDDANYEVTRNGTYRLILPKMTRINTVRR